MNNLLMLIGLPCSGKSTLIKNKTYLQLCCFDDEPVIISPDNIIYTVANHVGMTYNELFSDMANLSKKLSIKMARQAIEKEKDVIWDQTNLFPGSRMPKLELFPVSYRKIAIDMSHINRSSINVRMWQRFKDTKMSVPDLIMDDFEKRFKTPIAAEGFDEIYTYNHLANTFIKEYPANGVGPTGSKPNYGLTRDMWWVA